MAHSWPWGILSEQIQLYSKSGIYHLFCHIWPSNWFLKKKDLEITLHYFHYSFWEYSSSIGQFYRTGCVVLLKELDQKIQITSCWQTRIIGSNEVQSQLIGGLGYYFTRSRVRAINNCLYILIISLWKGPWLYPRIFCGMCIWNWSNYSE